MTKGNHKKLEETRAYLKNKISNLNFDSTNYIKERKQVYDLLKRTIDSGESNSALLIGPKGVGKTALVNDVIAELQKGKTFASNAILVRLHGLVHTDDRLALRSITLQMNLDNAVDGKVFGSFAENLAFLLACLRTGRSETSKSVVFILDEFDLLCAHHNQTLLYNLFDVSQSAQTPICVLGITCRLDVIELLEKRVKSRFQHRQIFLYPGGSNPSETSELEFRINKIESLLKLNSEKNISYKKQWNQEIDNLVQKKKFRQLMERLLDIDPTEDTLKNILVSVVSKLSEEIPVIKVGSFQEEMENLEKDELVCILQDLTALEVCMLIAMKHHVEIYDNQPMNFEMIYTRYAKFTNANSNLHALQRSVVMKAFEHLQDLELIAPIGAGGGRLQKEYQMYKLLITSNQINDAVKKCLGLPTEIVQWATTSLL